MIITSSIVSASPQIDGRSQVRELHIADDGRVWTIDYVSSPGDDIYQTLADRSAFLSNAPEDQLPVAQRMLLRKTIVDRLSDVELASVMAAFELPENLRLKAMWYAAIVIDPVDDVVVDTLTAMFGGERAAELLQVVG